MQKLLKVFNDYYKFLVITVLFVIPLYPKFPLIAIAGTYVNIRLEDFMILAIFLIWLFLNYKKTLSLLNNGIIRSFAIFILVGTVSIVSALLITHSISLQAGFLHLVRRIEYFIGFLIGFSLIINKLSLRFVITSLVIIIFVLFGYGVGQKYFNFPIVTTQNYEYSKGIALRYTSGGHLPSTFAGHYDLASYIVLVSPIFFTLFFLSKSNKEKLVLFLAIGATYWLLINAVSRISIVAFIVSVSVSLFTIKKYKQIFLFILVTLIVSLFSTSLIGRYSRIIEVTIKRFSTELRLKEVYALEESKKIPIRRQNPVPAASVPTIFEDRSTSIRLNVEWPRALRAFLKNPFLGTGFSSITLATDNDYLRILGEAGILGFVAFMLVIAKISLLLKEFTKTSSKFAAIEKAFLAGVLGAFPGILLIAFFIDIFEASKFALSFWLIYGMAASLISRKNEQTI